MSGFFTVIKAAITSSGLEAAPYEVVKKAEVSYFVRNGTLNEKH